MELELFRFIDGHFVLTGWGLLLAVVLLGKGFISLTFRNCRYDPR